MNFYGLGKNDETIIKQNQHNQFHGIIDWWIGRKGDIDVYFGGFNEKSNSLTEALTQILGQVSGYMNLLLGTNPI